MEFFPGRPFPGEIGKALRVSRYFPDGDEEGHVRFSVWNETGVARAVVSLAEADAARLADFVRDSAPARSDPCEAPGDAGDRAARTIPPFRTGRNQPRSGLPRRRPGSIVAQ